MATTQRAALAKKAETGFLGKIIPEQAAACGKMRRRDGRLPENYPMTSP
jgi:hypothetical protein